MRKGRDKQSFPIVEVHLVRRELPGREHVEDLTDVRVRAGDELVNDVRGDLEFLPIDESGKGRRSA